MLQFFAAAVCAAVLAACGGGGDKTPKPVVIVQPAYKVTETAVGTGRAAAAGDIVTFTYVGYLYDSTKSDFKGQKVESSVDTNSTFTATVGVGAILPGWDQTLLGMQAGGKRTAILPANLAYGANTRDAQGIYAAIAANSPLVYDFVMVNVIPQVTIPNQPPPTVLTVVANTPGTGTAIVAGKQITVNYTGWLYDGTRPNFKGAQFDSSLTKGVPLGFTVGGNGVIPGFSTAVIGMQVGGSRTVIIPPDQAYGAAGTTSIPPNATLVFDITVVTSN
nr:FKBP-type peptidyl-prolyl cis-trans isomerase [Duganella sp. 1224]